MRQALTALLGFWLVVTAMPGVAQVLHDLHGSLACTVCHRQDPPEPFPPPDPCVACHGTMIDPPASPLPEGPDPHRSPHLAPGEVPVCTECHSIHGRSEPTCTICHQSFEFKME